MLGSLMTSRRFAPLFWCQFFSAFTDNLVKQALIILIAFQIAGPDAGPLIQLTNVALLAPTFLLAALGGQLADRYDKALIARWLKLGEIGAAAIAGIGFLLGSIEVIFAAVFISGALSALFGPIKYGILPDHLKREELPGGNALVEGATFLAILTGTILGGVLAAGHGDPILLGGAILLFSVLCWGASCFIPPTGQGAPNLKVEANIFRSTLSIVKDSWGNIPIRRASLMVSWFWMIGAVVLSLLATVISQSLGGREEVVTAYLAVFSVGIGVGSLLASWLASGRIILLPTPVAAVLMGFFLLDAGSVVLISGAPQASLGLQDFFALGPGYHLAVDFFGMAVAGGLFIVPAFSAVQAWSEPAKRARVIAAVNIMSSGFMVCGALIAAALQKQGMTAAHVLLLIGVANLLVAAVIFKYLPTSPVRDLLSILFRAFYRLEVRGADNLLNTGPHTIVALNHVSFLDAAVALSILDTDPVFAINRQIAQRWWVKPFLRLMRTISLDPANPMKTRSLIAEVRKGRTLVIFPEGRLTVTGSLMKVYDGAALIADKSGAMIVPVRLDGLEHTLFSRLSRDQVRRRWLPKVTVTVLEPVKLTVAAELKGKHRRHAAGAALYQIMSDLIFRTTSTERTIHEAVVQAATKHGRDRVALEDPLTGTLTYKRLLSAARVVGRKLAPLAPIDGAIGVMLPNSNAAAVTVLGLTSAGRVPAMINFSAGTANIQAACKAAQITSLITSKAFIEKANLGKLVSAISESVRVTYLEDVRSSISIAARLEGLIKWKRPIVSRAPGDRAVILFTSGSEGTPKGVVLSHRNILANAAQGASRLDFGRTDQVFNILPLFHSFGLTVGLFLPLIFGVRVFLYPSPLHYRLIPELLYSTNATILFGTDTFLAGYARHANAYDFRSVRFILAGAEPVKEETRRTYMEKFGLRILEGYGVTEAAPALALNTPMFNKHGTVGRILPGMEVRLEAVPGIEDGGRLFIRGPNIMLGYLRAENPGVLEPPNGGWHDTGDIVGIDDHGFLTIKGRAKRFAKIGGEMISLAAVEALAGTLWPAHRSAITAAPDVRKGERLILVTENPAATRSEFIAHAKAAGASDLMIPSEVIVVASVPVLATGKLDHGAVAKLVAEREDQGMRSLSTVA